MARIAALGVENRPQPVNASRRVVGGREFGIEHRIPGVKLTLLQRRERVPRVRRMSVVLDIRAQDDERSGERSEFQFGAGAATGVIEAMTDGSVEPLNCSTRSLLAGNSNSTILCGRGHSRDPEKSFDLMGESPSTTSSQ